MNVPSVKSLARTCVATVVFFASVRPAAADEPNAALAWGLTAGELATAGVLALNFGSDVIPNHGPGMIVNFTPLLVGPALAYGADAGGFAATPALSVHGGGWLGLNLFMVGALVDGRDRPFGLRAGKTAWTLGVIGAIGGGLIGATAVNGKDESIAWLAAPPGGFTVGLLLIGGAIVIASGPDGDKAGGQLALGAITGLTLGLGAATYLAYRGIGDTSTASQSVVPLDGPRRVFSLGGTF